MVVSSSCPSAAAVGTSALRVASGLASPDSATSALCAASGAITPSAAGGSSAFGVANGATMSEIVVARETIEWAMNSWRFSGRFGSVLGMFGCALWGLKSSS